MMQRYLCTAALSLSSALALLACASSSSSSSAAPVDYAAEPTEPAQSVEPAEPAEPAEPEPGGPEPASIPPENQPSVVVASARMVGDCFDTRGTEPSAGLSDRRAAPTCFDSSLNLSVRGNGERRERVTVKTVRLLRPDDDKVLAELRLGEPQRWTNAGYVPWDSYTSPGEQEVIYFPVGSPKWSDVEARMDGAPSEGQPFRLQIELVVGDEAMTIFSPMLHREFDDMMVT